MATAVITITDEPGGADRINVKLNFGDAGAKDDSAAHRTAVEMLSKLAARLKNNADEDDDS